MKPKNYKEKTGYTQDPLKILNNPIDTGYMVKTNQKTASQSSTWNAMLLTDDNVALKLWVEEVSMDFSMSGSTGQSRYRRQFYPKAFNQPTMKVMGRMPNQYEYNKLASFIRESHFYSLNQSSQNVGAGGVDINGDKKTIKLYIKDAGKGRQPKRNQKGGHLPMGFQGYIKTIAAGATKFQFAPTFQFEFVIASSVDTGQIGIYSDTLTQGSKIASWMDLFKKYHFAWGSMTPSEAEILGNKGIAAVIAESGSQNVNEMSDAISNNDVLGTQK